MNIAEKGGYRNLNFCAPSISLWIVEWSIFQTTDTRSSRNRNHIQNIKACPSEAPKKKQWGWKFLWHSSLKAVLRSRSHNTKTAPTPAPPNNLKQKYYKSFFPFLILDKSRLKKLPEPLRRALFWGRTKIRVYKNLGANYKPEPGAVSQSPKPEPTKTARLRKHCLKAFS